jgi:hypothetical protein
LGEASLQDRGGDAAPQAEGQQFPEEEAMIVSPAISLSVAANAVSANVMSGNLFEVISRPSLVEFGLTASNAGILATIMLGNEIIAQDQEISSANRYPIVPDDWILKAGGRPGAKIYITLRNRTAGALTAWVILNITPLG